MAVEKEEIIMKERSVFFTEAKISLPIYKVVYSAFFTVVLRKNRPGKAGK